MDQRTKLIELLSQYFNIGDSYEYICGRHKSAFEVGTMTLDDFTEFDEEKVTDIADFLLSVGIVVLPCKVGDEVYVVRRGLCKWRDLDQCENYCDGYENIDGCWQGSKIIQKENFHIEMLGYFGKTVFLTIEEAEAALEKSL